MAVTSMSKCGDNVVPTIDEVYEGAIAEHPELFGKCEKELKAIVGDALSRIVELEHVANEPLVITKEVAEDIGTVWIFSGTGSYDEPYKPEDNPAFVDLEWTGGMDRARISRGTYLVRKIAELRSGEKLERGPIADPVRLKRVREMILEHGPTIVYNGYPVENENAEELLTRAGTIIPKEKADIIGDNLKTTTDQIKSFKYPDDPKSKDKNVLLISHAAHLAARIPHLIDKHRPFARGALPYVSPIATPEIGRREAALMETRGLIGYIFTHGVASETPYPYQLLSGPSNANPPEAEMIK